jgi:hypothetical protein
MDRWQFKVRTLRRMVRGWAANEVANLNRNKASLIEKFRKLEDIMETRSLEPIEMIEYRDIEEELSHIWALEEIKAR